MIVVKLIVNDVVLWYLVGNCGSRLKICVRRMYKSSGIMVKNCIVIVMCVDRV